VNGLNAVLGFFLLRNITRPPSLPATMTFYGFRIDVALRLFVVPLLISSLPDFAFSANSTDKWLIEVKIW